MPIPCHLILGPLGVGKTTAILDLIQRHAGWERMAVLVNDFGPIGLDGAILDDSGATVPGAAPNVVTIPGGCICCSAAEGLVSGFRKISKVPKMTRLIIEPSGIADPGEVVDMVRSLCQEYGYELRPAIGMIDLRDLEEVMGSRMPLYRRLVEAADILVANRSDLTTSEKAKTFLKWTGEMYPPKVNAVVTHHGMLPDQLFELPMAQTPRKASLARLPVMPGLLAKHEHGHVITQTAGGFVLDAEVVFDAEKMDQKVLEILRVGFMGKKVLRFKAVMHTDKGWKLYEIARGDVFTRATAYRRDSRADWIAEEGEWNQEAFKQWWMEALRLKVEQQ
jgi:G3E family GTPase